MIKKILRKITSKLIYLFVNVPYRIKFEGLENLNDVKSACILTPNHQNILDPLFLITKVGTEATFLAKKEASKEAFGIGKIATSIYDLVLVDRENIDIKAIKEIYKRIDAGNKIVIFPEGTRNGVKKGENFKAGAVHIALKKHIPIIPVGINQDLKIFKPNLIKLGKPIYISKEQDIYEVTKNLQTEVFRLAEKQK